MPGFHITLNTLYMINADIESICQAANSDECSAATCTADAAFLKSIMNFSDPSIFNMMTDPSFKGNYRETRPPREKI